MSNDVLIQFRNLIADIESTARKLGQWDGQTAGCYLASSAAWEAGLPRPGSSKDRVELSKKLSRLLKEVDELFVLSNVHGS